MFGDSLTDYFPMEKLSDIDAKMINSGQAGDTIAEMGARVSCDVIVHQPDVVLMQGGPMIFDVVVSGISGSGRPSCKSWKKDSEVLPETKIYIESMYPAYTKRIGLMHLGRWEIQSGN